jgi:hypothetical protein
MSKPRKYKGETIFNYLPEYLPSVDIENPIFVKLPADRKDTRLKDVEREIIQYWEIIHPLVREHIVMLAKYVNDLGEGTEEVDHLRRSLELEINNSAELSEENRKLKAQISDLVIDKKGLDEKLKDMMKSRPSISGEEFKALKMLTSSKFDVSSNDLETLLKRAIQEIRESEEIKRAREDRDKMQKELDEAKKNFEKIQTEVGETFQKKLLASQARIDELEEEVEKLRS